MLMLMSFISLNHIWTCELFISVNLPQKQRQKISRGKNKWEENYFLHIVKISDDEVILDFRNFPYESFSLS